MSVRLPKFFGCLLVLAFNVIVCNTDARADHYALLVGIHDYLPVGASEHDLPGVENDLRLMAETLVRCYEFVADDTHLIVLQGTEATRSAIVKGFEAMASRVGEGDSFLFYYSGHGTMIPADSDQGERRFDQGICPADVGLSSKKVIRDKELGRLLKAIRGKKAVILDCCFSGSGTRDLTLTTAVKAIVLPDGGCVGHRPDVSSRCRGVDEGQMDHVLIAACRGDQTSRVMTLDCPSDVPIEKRYRISAMTFFLCYGLRGSADVDRNGEITFGEAAGFARRCVSHVFSAADDQRRNAEEPRVVPGQTVQLEGDRPTDPVFFVGKYKPLAPHVFRSGDSHLVDVGAAYGFRRGTSFRVPNDNARISISDLRLFESHVTINLDEDDGDGDDEATDSDETMPVEANTVDSSETVERLAVKFVAEGQDRAFSAMAKRIVAPLCEESFIEVVEREDAAADVAIVVCRSDHVIGFGLVNPGGRVDVWGSVADDHPERLTEEIRCALAQAFAIKRLSGLLNPAAAFSVHITTNRGDDQPMFRVGEEMQLMITATEPCYITLIDIGTSGALSILYPPAGRQSPRLEPGQVLRLPPANGKIKIVGPSGVDRIKVIATHRPVPVSATVATKGAAIVDGAKKILDAMGSLSGTALCGDRKDVGDCLIPVDQWAETSLDVEIVPNQGGRRSLRR